MRRWPPFPSLQNKVRVHGGMDKNFHIRFISHLLCWPSHEWTFPCGISWTWSTSVLLESMIKWPSICLVYLKAFPWSKPQSIFILILTTCVYVCVLVTQSCLTLCNPVDCSPPGSSVHGILQARMLEWVAVPFSTGSSQLWDQTQVSCIAGIFFTDWVTRKACVLVQQQVPGLKMLLSMLKRKNVLLM